MKRFFLGFLLGSISLAVSAQSVSDLMNRGRQAFEREDFAAARTLFGQAAESGRSPEALLWSAKTSLSLLDLSNAGIQLDAYLSSRPSQAGRVEAEYLKGRLFLLQEQYGNALVQFDRFLELPEVSPYVSNTLFWMGEAAYALGQWDKARSLFRRVIEEFPSSFKIEASRYRMALIELKIREEQLLQLLKWSHEELVAAQERFEGRERALMQALQALQSNRAASPASPPLGSAQPANIPAASPGGTNLATAPVPVSGAAPSQVSVSEASRDRILALKQRALELKRLLLEEGAQNAR